MRSSAAVGEKFARSTIEPMSPHSRHGRPRTQERREKLHEGHLPRFFRPCGALEISDIFFRSDNMLALLSLTSALLPTQPISGAVRSGVMPTAANTRRAALFAGSTAVLSMLPTSARADAIADIAARNNAKAMDDRLNKDEIAQEGEDRQVLILLAISAVVFAGPITGIKGAEKAIDSMSTRRGDDDALRANLKGKGGKAKPAGRPAGKMPWEK
jgi:hypothetical protein